MSHDKHLRVFHSSRALPQDDDQERAPSAAELAQERASFAIRNFGFEKAERMQGNIGYVDIRASSPSPWEVKRPRPR